MGNNGLTGYDQDMSGVLQLAESLKVNTSLTSLSYVQPERQPRKCQDPLTIAWYCVGSLWNNSIGPGGAEALGEALKTNSTLQNLKYAARLPVRAVNTC